jgi:glyoxylate reductase
MPSSTKPFVLFFNPVRHAKSFYTKFQDVAHTEVVTSKSREEFYKDIQGKYKDIFALYTTSTSTAVSRDCNMQITTPSTTYYVWFPCKLVVTGII